MSNEIVTVEYNGEVFEVQVPTGSSQEDIESFLSSQESPPPPEDAGVESMPSLEQEEPFTDMSEWGDRGITKYTGELVGEVKEAGLDFLALADVATTIGTGAASSITVAAAGAAAMLFGRDPEQTAREVEHYSQVGTWIPKGERGRELLEDIAEPLMKLEEAASDFSAWLAGDNPAAATATKTALLGVVELALPYKGSKRGLKVGQELRKRAADMETLAADLGVDISQSGLAASVVALAKRMTPAQRAEHMPYLREQLKAASEKALARKDQLYEEARASQSFVDRASAAELSASIKKDLEFEGYVLSDKKMKNISDRLDELANMKPDETGTRVNLKEYDDVRKRINTMRQKNNTAENRALNIMNKRMGEWLDAEFDKIALNQGSALSGEAAGVAAWKAARGAARDWHKRFNTDRVIKNFINKDATAETMARWLLGASAMGANREAGAIIGRMKEVLGDNHPAIQGVRTDFLFEVVSPLLHPDGPNFNQFIRNYELIKVWPIWMQ